MTHHRPFLHPAISYACLVTAVIAGPIAGAAEAEVAEPAERSVEHAPVTSANVEPERKAADLREGSTPIAKTPSADAAEIRGLLNLGASLTDRNEYDSAEIAFRRVMNTAGVSAPDLQSALLGLARMHRRQGSLIKAAAIYEKFLKDYPGSERSPDALLDLGRTHRAMGAYKL